MSTLTMASVQQPEPVDRLESSSQTIVRVKRITIWGIALLWLLDAILQAQPLMYTVDFKSQIMTPAVAAVPSFLTGLANWTTDLVTSNMGIWNWGFTTIQFVIAISLLLGLVGRKERLLKAGLILSIVWGLGVWVFGEGTSGVFTGTGTILTGAPGSVLLYVLIAAFYFLPDSWWNLKARFCLPRDALALVFLYGVIAQVLTQPFWGQQGIPALLAGQTAMAPSWLVPGMNPAVSLTSHIPALWNALLTAAMAAIVILLFGRRPRLAGFVVLGVTLAVVWYWGQAFGGIFNGMGTDPNTPPLFVIMAIPAWFAMRESKRDLAGQSDVVGRRLTSPREVATAGGVSST